MKTIIYYFTGTGNSLWLARRLGELIGGAKLVALGGEAVFDKTADMVGFVFPVHLWRAPRVVEAFAETIMECPNTYFFSLADYKSDCGNYSERFAKLIGKRNKLSAAFEISMPGNNIIYYSAESEEEQRAKFAKAEQALTEAAWVVLNRGERLPQGAGFSGKAKSTVLSGALTKSFAAADRSFFVADSCSGCGLCEKVCPVGNIKLINGKPTWRHRCAQCVGCINICPKGAIEFGKTTAGKTRYVNPRIGVRGLLEGKCGASLQK